MTHPHTEALKKILDLALNPETERIWITEQKIINICQEALTVPPQGEEAKGEMFTWQQVDYILSRFVCFHAPKYSTEGTTNGFIEQSKKDKQYPAYFPVAPVAGNLLDREAYIDRVISEWVLPVSRRRAKNFMRTHWPVSDNRYTEQQVKELLAEAIRMARLEDKGPIPGMAWDYTPSEIIATLTPKQ